MRRNALLAAVLAAVAVPRPSAGADPAPEVAPGKVRWHRSFEGAQQAAKSSGKPVLLFHLMGRLDRQFC